MISRNYCFTIFDENWKYETNENISYLCYQKEKTPSTNKIHLQGYLELIKPCRIKLVKKFLKCDAHLETRKGTQAQAINYCKKSESSVENTFFETGTPAKQGRRTDLSKLSELKDKNIETFFVENPLLTLKYSRGITVLKNAYNKLEMKKVRNLKVSVLIGPPGCGKTRYVYDNFSSIYKLNTNTNNTLWFDGYSDEEVLLIDDFKGWIKFTELLTILDIYPYRCQIKGGYCYAKWNEVIVTSNYPIEDWYNDVNLEALKRRIHYTKNMRNEVEG